MAIEILYIGNGCLGKHPFVFGCLVSQVVLVGWSPQRPDLSSEPGRGDRSVVKVFCCEDDGDHGYGLVFF